MQVTPQHKTFLFGLSISILVLASATLGALADRLFVIKPLDYLTGNIRQPLAQSAASRNSTTPLSGLNTGNSSVADIAESASQSVVTVSVKRQEPVFDESGSVLDFGFGFFGLPRGEIREVQRDIGTGFVAGDGGLIVTNKHVVSDPNAEYLVIDRDNQEYTVSKVYRDPTYDLAILKAEAFQGTPMQLGDSEQLRVGEGVIAIGTALGEFRHTVTTGVISGLGRGIQAIDPSARAAEELEGVIQTDAAINPGNSGGPLLNAVGQVIGVNVAVSAGAENIGFALPINMVKASIDNFHETGEFNRAFLGVSYRTITEQAALMNEVPQGAYITQVVENSTAAEAGLTAGDIVIRFGGQKVADEDLAKLINQHRVGEAVAIEYWRDGDIQTVSVTLRGQ